MPTDSKCYEFYLFRENILIMRNEKLKLWEKKIFKRKKQIFLPMLFLS